LTLTAMNVAIDIVSDFVCPWCFIGKARLTSAIALVHEKHPQTRFQFSWLPYFLNPDTPPSGEPYRAYLEAKFGGARAVAKLHAQLSEAGRDAGIDFDFERIAKRPNTLLAHRLIYRAQSLGHRPAEIEALVDRLFSAHFQRGEDIGDIATLAAIAGECGDAKADVAAYLESGADIKKIKSLVAKVGGLGVDGVPFFIIQRRLTVSGAQTGVILAAAILQAMQAVK
jgi:predicted DsbA family dithiol-disulfide isomerase